ncbi:MAG: transposase, partial [Desulfonauticus sp.]|nr:transposase [Desulfonauticus sp.]
LAFLNYPKEVRKHIYTTNPVEGLNRGLELMRLDLGGYFPSQRCLETNLFVQLANPADKWQRKPMPRVRAVLPELRQLLVLRYELEEI